MFITSLTPTSRRVARAIDSKRWIEPLEERQFFSAAPAQPSVDLPLKTQSPVFANKIAKNGVTNILPITINGVNVVNGGLMAVGQIGSNIFQTPITVTAKPNPDPAKADCPILSLQLGPINLDVLGLKVDTSKICLDITADPTGGLLGNLLCGVANLLNGGSSLGSILGGLTGTQLNDLLGGITNLLNGALGAITAPSAVSGVSGTAAGATDILNLALGPVDLNLLGLKVHLDNCANGPVTVDITAESGPGKLLGNLLGGFTHLLDNPSNPTASANLLSRVSGLIGGLLG
ncbi:MAG TPA: hypothetical protein VGP94_15555 [Tepidisphaeraceae bacterium]|jgi:hypothetical protein|nr:hypothetical protein [Tepidisphaeraceae bacterium]